MGLFQFLLGKAFDVEGVITEAHLAKLSMLKYLGTSSNSKLTFNVSREWKPPFQLMAADLSSNKIINGFPEWLMLALQDLCRHGCGRCPSLIGSYSKALFLQDNLFNESIPISLCRRIDLIYLNLARNRLSGKLPNCLGNMRNLRTMQFSSNQLSGVVPSSILSQSSTLSWLNLNDNQFIGELPQELGNLLELQILDLGDNRFSGNLP
ncbi:leucine-rich repeat protein [Tanacetum coccineum]